MENSNNCATLKQKIEQHFFKIIKIIDMKNLSENDFSSDILPNWILNELGFEKERITETTYNIGTLLYFLQNSTKKSINENQIENTIHALAISSEIEKLKRKKKIEFWKSKNPLNLKSSITVQEKL